MASPASKPVTSSSADKPTSNQIQRSTSPVVELLFAEDGVVDRAGQITGHVKAYAGKNAFRVYSVLNESIGKNTAGTLRGIVRSARWRAAFSFATEWGEAIEFVALLASFASNIAEARSEFEAIHTAKESQALKAVHFIDLARKVANRTAIGIVVGGVHGVYQSLMGLCMIGGAVTGGLQDAQSNQCVQIIKSADWMVKTAGRKIADQPGDSLHVIEIILTKRESSASSSTGPR